MMIDTRCMTEKEMQDLWSKWSEEDKTEYLEALEEFRPFEKEPREAATAAAMQVIGANPEAMNHPVVKEVTEIFDGVVTAVTRRMEDERHDRVLRPVGEQVEGGKDVLLGEAGQREADAVQDPGREADGEGAGDADHDRPVGDEGDERDTDPGQGDLFGDGRRHSFLVDPTGRLEVPRKGPSQAAEATNGSEVDDSPSSAPAWLLEDDDE